MKIQKIRRALFVLSLLLNFILIREVIKYEPQKTRNRFWFALRRTGWFDKRVDLEELRSSSTMIALAIGQSNAANYSDYVYSPKNKVFTYYKGQLYKAEEPLLGASGNGGSVWSILGDQLIDSGLYKKVVIIPIAVAGSSSEDWVKGDCSIKLKEVLAGLTRNNIHLTHIFWHQGETDNGTSKESYKQNLRSVLGIIREKNQTAPFYCSIASYNFSATHRYLGIDTSLQNAQKEFISENINVYRGANTDSLIYAIHRYDGQHFSQFGLLQFSRLWYEAIVNNVEH